METFSASSLSKIFPLDSALLSSIWSSENEKKIGAAVILLSVDGCMGTVREDADWYFSSLNTLSFSDTTAFSREASVNKSKKLLDQ